MDRHLFNTRKTRLWALLPLITLIWHGYYTVGLHPHYLLFVCYASNLLLVIGMVVGSGLLVGTSFGWILIALPLWLYDAVLNSNWQISGIAFHMAGVFVGGLAIKDYRMPKYTWCAGLGLGILLQFLSGRFTEESLNVNAAFRVYDGWEGTFSNYTIYILTMVFGFGVFFIVLTWFNNRFLFKSAFLMKEINRTKSICPQCLKVIPSIVYEKDNQIRMRKQCQEHGEQDVLISSSIEWFHRAMESYPYEQESDNHHNSLIRGCPYRCGPCPEHSRPMYLPVVPVTSACNLDCPVCYTHNKNVDPYHMTREEFASILSQMYENDPRMQIINFTGGEPLIHPHFCDLVEMCREAGVHRITISTNGLRLLEDESLLDRLTEMGARIVFSFNSFKPEPYQITAGTELLDKKLRILRLLEKYKPSTTLLTVAARGVNDRELGDIVSYVLASDFIVSSEIHTITFTGQNAERFNRSTRLTIPDVIGRIVEEIPEIGIDDFIPSSCAHPLCYSTCYLMEISDSSFVPFTGFIRQEDLQRMLSDSLYMEPSQVTEDVLKDTINDIWSQKERSEKDHQIIEALRYLLDSMFSPRDIDVIARQRIAERSIKAIYIHSHMDEENFDVERVQQCSVAVADGKGGQIPTCSYNIVYRARDPRFCSGLSD